MKRLFTVLSIVAFSVLSQGVELTSPSPIRDAAWVQARVQEIAIKKEERKVDEIGWAKDIREAKRLAKESGRPVFLFTHDGRLNIGRC